MAAGFKEKLAIVGPSYFSYIQAIACEFERRGYSTAVYDEKASNSVLAKAAFRLGVSVLVGVRQRRHLDWIAARIVASGAREVLLIGVEVINRPFVAQLAAAGLRVHLYLWDGQANKGRFRDYLDLTVSCATFDPQDANALRLGYVPLFAEPEFDRRAMPVNDIGFCGTMHSARPAAIAGLLEARLRLGLRLYYHSRALFAVKGFTALRLLPLVTSKAVPKSEVAALFASSRYVLDIPHPGQTGLTARTFEALLAGARLLTANRNAHRLLPPSLASRVVVFDDVTEIPAIVRRECSPLPPLTEQERRYLSLARFVDDLLAQMTRPLAQVA